MRATACGPLRSFVTGCAWGSGWCGKGTPEQATPLHRWRSARCADYPAMLGLAARRRTRCVRCAHYAQTSATSQSTIRAARGATSPVLLGACEALRGLSGRTFAKRQASSSSRRPNGRARRAVPAGGDLWGGEERSPGVGGRSTPRKLTHRGCLSAVSEANVASSAMRPQGEHHSGVGAQRRPLQCEPPAGTARRAARKPCPSSQPRTTATGRMQPIDARRSCVVGRAKRVGKLT